jgi:dimethylargininase
MKALMREPSDALERCALTWLERRPIDLARARAQHAAYRSALRALGVEVRVLAAEPDLPDAVFVEDAAVVVEECAVVTRPGLDSRRGEIESVAAALEPVRPVSRITAPGTLEGGDVLRVGRTLFVGQTPRTNTEGTRQLSTCLEPHGYDVVAVTPTGCLHLKSAATFVGDETLLVNPEWIDVGQFSRWQCVPVAPEEPFGANALLVGDTVFTAASAPLTRRKLDALGFHTEVLDTSEFEKAEAALTCLSILIR